MRKVEWERLVPRLERLGSSFELLVHEADYTLRSCRVVELYDGTGGRPGTCIVNPQSPPLPGIVFEDHLGRGFVSYAQLSSDILLHRRVRNRAQGFHDIPDNALGTLLSEEQALIETEAKMTWPEYDQAHRQALHRVIEVWESNNRLLDEVERYRHRRTRTALSTTNAVFRRTDFLFLTRVMQTANQIARQSVDIEDRRLWYAMKDKALAFLCEEWLGRRNFLTKVIIFPDQGMLLVKTFVYLPSLGRSFRLAQRGFHLPLPAISRSVLQTIADRDPALYLHIKHRLPHRRTIKQRP